MRSIDPRRLRNWIVVGSLIAAISAVVVAYPYFLGASTDRLGVRGVAATLLGLVAISFAWSRWRGSQPALQGLVKHGVTPTLVIPGLLAGALLSGSEVWLQLVPCLIYGTLAEIFRASMRDGSSMIQSGATWLVPEAPDFIGAYCRKLTWFWVAFFAASALLIAAFALSGASDWWAFYTGKLVYILMMGISAVEFFVRKTWFRYYFHMGPFDRLWSSLFPAENTAQGRESEAYIRLFKPERD